MKTKFITLLLGLIFLASCAPPKLPSPEQKLEQFWQQQQKYKQINTYYLQGSLSFKDQKQASRLLYTCFGQKNKLTRVDFSSSLGQKISLWQESQNNLLVFFPYERRAYQSNHPRTAITTLGFPLPFTLTQSVKLLLGEVQFLLPLSSSENFSKNLLTQLEIYPLGQIKRINYQGYTISYFNYVKTNINLSIPKKIIIEKEGLKITIYQKKIKLNLNLNNLELKLPEDVNLFNLLEQE